MYRLLIISHVPEFRINSIHIATIIKELFVKKLHQEKESEFDSIEVITQRSRNRVLNELKSLSYFLRDAGNKAYIYYYGHGDQVSDYSGDEVDGKDEIWRTQGILDDEISSFFTDINSSSRLYLFSDSCSSGSMIDKELVQSNWVTISSSNDKQDSLATSDGGVFTLWGLIPAIENINGITPVSLHNWVRDNIDIPSQTSLLHYGNEEIINEEMF